MQYLKAAVGALIAGLGSAATAVTDGHVTAAEWIAIALATLVALGAVWGVPNAAPVPYDQGGLPPPRMATVRNGGEAAERIVPPSKVCGYTGGQIQPPTTRGTLPPQQ